MQQDDKISVYQLFLRFFSNKNTTNKFYGTLAENGSGKFKDIQAPILRSIKQLGITHIWYTGVIEHATLEDFSDYGINPDHPQIVKGIAGSPYAIKDYYDVNPYLAGEVPNRMQEFEDLVARTHSEGLKVIIDFVPNHVARSYSSDRSPEGTLDFGQEDDIYKAFDPQNNFYYIPNQDFQLPDGILVPKSFSEPYSEYPAKATGNDVFSAQPSNTDWFETVKLNYGLDYFTGQKHFNPIPNTWFKMLEILRFWAEKGVDGFRCDMAEMVPVEFWNWALSNLKTEFPECIFIAEVYNPNLYSSFLEQGKFDYLYDKVGLYDTLKNIVCYNAPATDITKVWQQQSGHFSNRMIRFLENHDEHRIASPFFMGSATRAIPAMMLTATLHTGPVMIYGGQEFGVKPEQAEGFSGNDGRTTIFDFWALPELQHWLNHLCPSIEQEPLYTAYKQILNFALEQKTVREGAFHDLQYLNGFWQSKGYDERDLYSYLRFTENQCLLFVYNFSQSQSHHFDLVLPAPYHHGYTVRGLFQDEEYASNAIHLHMEANTYRVFEVYNLNIS